MVVKEDERRQAEIAQSPLYVAVKHLIESSV